MEAAGDSSQLLALCGDDIEFWPPDGPPAVGREAVVAWLHRGEEKIQSIEVNNCHVRGSNKIAYLTASYKTTLTSPSTGQGRQISGSHLWILQNRAGTWQISLVTWSRWD